MAFKPYRIVIFSRGALKGLKGQRGYAYHGWTSTQHYIEARLPNAGSFLFPGLYAVRRAAMEYLALPETHQVQIRTNQDRKLYLWNKHADGTISGYRPENDRG